MKTNWLKQNLLSLIGSVIVLALMGTTIWFIHQANSSKRQTEDALIAAQQQIEQLRRNTPFPSAENIRELQNDNEKVQRLYTALREAATRNPLAVPAHRGEVGFVSFLRNRQRDWRAAAEVAKVELPENFSFGFSRYDTKFPCRMPPLRDQDCQQLLDNLSKQVVVVDKVYRIALGSGVTQLIAIRRLDLEEGQTGGDALPPLPPANPKALFRVLPVEIKFSGDEKAFRTFVNNIAKAKEFLVLRNLSFETETYTVALTSPTLPASLTGMDLRSPESTTPQQETRQRLVVTARVEWVETETKPGDTPRGNK